MLFEIDNPAYEKLPFLLTTLGSNGFQEAMSRPMGCGFHQLIWVAEGSGRFILPDRQVTLGRYQGVLTRQGVPISYSAAGERFATAWITFCGSGSEGLLDYYGIGQYLLLTADEQLLQKRALLEHRLNTRTVLERSVEGYAFVLELLQQITREGCEVSGIVNAVNSYLETHYAQPITLDEVARAIHMDRYTLCRQYKRQCGLTVMNHLRRLRILQAKVMLREQYPASQVGALCGFGDPSYFGKIFLRETGITPGQYRQAMSGAADEQMSGKNAL